MEILTKIFKQTFWQILGKVITSLSTFIILGMVARNYGENGTGIFTLALTYLAIFYLLSDFGFNAHALKKFQIEQFSKLLGTRLVWSGILVVIAVGLLPFWPFAGVEFNQAVLFGSLAIVGSGIFVTCNLIFQSKLRYDLSVLASSIGILTSLGLFLYFAYLRLPVPYLLLAHLVGWLVIALSALWFVKISLPIFDKQYAYNLFKQSWPVSLTLILNVVYFRADSFMIAYFKGVSDVGIYNVAYLVFQSVLVLPAFIMNSYYPLMLRSFKEIRVVGFCLLVLSFMGVILTLILAPFIIQILTGGGFEGSARSLQILSLGFPAYFLSAILMWVMVTKGQYKTMLGIYAAGLLFNLFLNFIYIPQFSFLAASWITVVSEYLILGLLAVSLKK